MRIEVYIPHSFMHKRSFLSLFLNMKKAYAITWRYGVLRDLSAMGSLHNCTFRLKIGNALSCAFIQKAGVFQGSVLSGTLFIFKMNTRRASLPPPLLHSV